MSLVPHPIRLFFKITSVSRSVVEGGGGGGGGTVRYKRKTTRRQSGARARSSLRRTHACTDGGSGAEEGVSDNNSAMTRDSRWMLYGIRHLARLPLCFNFFQRFYCHNESGRHPFERRPVLRK